MIFTLVNYLQLGTSFLQLCKLYVLHLMIVYRITGSLIQGDQNVVLKI